MNTSKRIMAMSSLCLMVIASAAHAETINVTLWDKGPKTDLAKDMGLGDAGDHMTANMGVKFSPDTVNAGEVTFVVQNQSKETIHEMLVVPLIDGKAPPFNDNEMRLAEDTAGDLGEVPETDPGKSGTLTVTLAPGQYMLFCNIPGHYKNGMWSVLTVK